MAGKDLAVIAGDFAATGFLSVRDDARAGAAERCFGVTGD